MPDPRRLTGTIKRIVREKGFGFISPPVGDDLFFHRSALVTGDFDKLIEGQAVSFELGTGGSKGPRAEQVRVE